MNIPFIIRKTDSLGRITIPKEFRRALGIKEGDAVEIYFNEKGDKSLTIKKYTVEKE